MNAQRRTWREVLRAERPLLLPVAHDALSARLIERAGFAAYSIGGFPLVGARYAAAVRDDMELARRIGITGVPFFVIDSHYGVSGAQSSATFLEALTSAAARWRRPACRQHCSPSPAGMKQTDCPCSA